MIAVVAGLGWRRGCLIRWRTRISALSLGDNRRGNVPRWLRGGQDIISDTEAFEELVPGIRSGDPAIKEAVARELQPVTLTARTRESRA